MESVEAEVVYVIRTKVVDRKHVGEKLMVRFDGSWEFLFLGNDCKLQIGQAVEIRIKNAEPSQPPL